MNESPVYKEVSTHLTKVQWSEQTLIELKEASLMLM